MEQLLLGLTDRLPTIVLEILGGILLLRGVLAVLMRALKRTPRLRALLLPSVPSLEFSSVAVPANLALSSQLTGVAGAEAALRVANMAMTMCLCWVALSFSLTFMFEGYFRHVRGVHVPVVIKTILRFLFLAAMVIMLLQFHFGVDVSGIAITAATVSIVFGVALKDTLSSLFSGIAMSVEGPFQVGDYLKVGELTGYVVDTNWRTTQLRSDSQDIVTVPNNRMADATIVNFFRPEKLHRARVEIDVDASAPPYTVQAVMVEVARRAHGVLKDPKPVARVVRVRDKALVYTLSYYVADVTKNGEIQSELISTIWYQLRRRGHVFAGNPDLAAAAVTPEAVQEIGKFLLRSPVFQALKSEQLEQIARLARRELYGRGEDIFRQGQPGDSYYVIRSGAVELLIGSGDPDATASRLVATLNAGAGFGERSLLTGEPRSASVRAAVDSELYVIDKYAFQEILMADQAVVERLSVALSEIQERDRRRKNEPESTASQLAETRKNIFSRITSFFQLS